MATYSAVLTVTARTTRRKTSYPVIVREDGWLEEARVAPGKPQRMWSPRYSSEPNVVLREARGVSW